MKKIENATQNLISKKHLYSHKTELEIGEWKKHFGFDYVNTIIAMALNHCIKNHELIVNGYLITKNSLFLIAKTHEKSIDTAIQKLEIHITFLLKINPEKVKKNKYEMAFIVDDDDLFYAVRGSLFKVYPLKNNDLTALLTGKKITLPYFNPELENLKSMIKNHPFCSAIDYSGAIGPVQFL
ncbi:hypothetical protein KHA90_11395 [Flavobacterium psychroterrae]|uniref:Uncharacterized protein n=1 Tax=Flavobacterium psychroterrae TaxID=2133767 RepID=A0ABS5PBF1_9FLAO|nr:hypothetical protein [Flavobacterium psychroterrae]MBS7231629.1 hypothetical protein [Flavobacterium psychroterrae]